MIWQYVFLLHLPQADFQFKTLLMKKMLCSEKLYFTMPFSKIKQFLIE